MSTRHSEHISEFVSGGFSCVCMHVCATEISVLFQPKCWWCNDAYVDAAETNRNTQTIHKHLEK